MPEQRPAAPLKILVIGYYGKQNAGDDLLQHAITDLFAPHHMLFTSWFPGMAALDEADVVVVGGGSIWPGNTFFAFGDRLAKEIRCPIVVIGISARNPSEDALQKTRKLIDAAAFFHVRDQQTADYFDRPGQVSCGPDLFWWAPFGPNEPGSAAANESVLLNLREWPSLEWNPSSIVDTIRRTQRPLRGWPLHFGAPESRDSTGNDLQFMSRLDVLCTSSSFTWHELLAARYVVAMRFHAVQIAIRLERPVIGFDYHPKVSAFFRENGLAELCVPLGDPKALANAIDRLESSFDDYLQKVRDLRMKLLADAEPLREALRTFVDSVPSRQGRPGSAFAPRALLRRIARSVQAR